MKKLFVMLFASVILFGCSSNESIDSSELLTEFVEPIPSFGVNQSDYIGLFGSPSETSTDNNVDMLIYQGIQDGEISRSIQFWERSSSMGEPVFNYAFILIHGNRPNLDFLTNFFSNRYGNYELIAEPGGSETETRQWFIPGEMIINLNYNFEANSGIDYHWLTYSDISD